MRVRRGLLRDVYVEDGRAVVFVNEQVVVLSEIATVILDATPSEGTASMEHLTTEVLKVFAPPGPSFGAAELIEQQVLDLVAHHVLGTDEVRPVPEVSPASVRALRACLQHLVSCSPDRWALPDDVPGEAFLAASERHRVTPVLARALDRLELPAPAAAQISAMAQQERATVSVLAADLSRVIDHLSDKGVRCLAFKGLPLAVQAYGDATARGTGDLDLLVHPSDLEDAYRDLDGAGWSAAGGLPTPGTSWAWRHFVRTGNEISLVSQTSMVDLHWHLTPAPSSSQDFEALWARSGRLDVLGYSVPTLAPYDALAHAAGHATKDNWHWLRGLLDVHRLVSDPFTWEGAEYPLTRDQLLAVGLAVHMFGTPDGAPDIVSTAKELAGAVLDEAVARQEGGSRSHSSEDQTRFPGRAMVQGLRRLRWSGASSTDIRRHVSRSALPHSLTAAESSPYATVAVPRVLAKRFGGIARRAWASEQR